MRTMCELDSDIEIVPALDPFGGLDENLSNQPINDPDD